MKNLVFKAEEQNVKVSFLKDPNHIFENYDESVKYCVVADKKVLEQHPEFKNVLSANNFSIFEIEEAEKQKDMETYMSVIELMQSKNFNRHDFVVGFGGGAVTDLAGFVAATYMRGIKYMQIPTSLLAQVDASIGGKTGINHGKIKNFIGSFYNPTEIFICSDFLVTLQKQEFLNGLAEVIKHCLITSRDSLIRLSEQSEAIMNLDQDVLLKCIKESLETKANIVQQDFQESGQRKFLNFGHTFAHGIESANYDAPILHGHAVMIGMLMALKYSNELGKLEKDELDLAIKVMNEFEYDFKDVKFDTDIIFEAMKKDKKNTNAINLVLINEIGAPFIYQETSEESLKTFISKFIDDFTK